MPRARCSAHFSWPSKSRFCATNHYHHRRFALAHPRNPFRPKRHCRVGKLQALSASAISGSGIPISVTMPIPILGIPGSEVGTSKRLGEGAKFFPSFYPVQIQKICCFWEQSQGDPYVFAPPPLPDLDLKAANPSGGYTPPPPLNLPPRPSLIHTHTHTQGWIMGVWGL